MRRLDANEQLSILFCCSTTLTEWITTQKVVTDLSERSFPFNWSSAYVASARMRADSQYSLYRTYKGLVGQFLPVETGLIYVWGMIRGTRKGGWEKVQNAPLAVSEANRDAGLNGERSYGATY